MSTQTFDAQHEDMLHDAQLDYYSKRLATCSSDRVIKVFNIGPDQVQTHAADLTGHEGPVWQVAWAHPRFGSLLASCGYDRRVIVWKEGPSNVWTRVYEYTGHDASVNAIAWAPQEHGLCLATASSDGNVTVLDHNDDDTWTARVIRNAHQIGCNSVSWAPAANASGSSQPSAGANGAGAGGANAAATSSSSSSSASASQGQGSQVRRLATGGCDNLVSIWVQDGGPGSPWRLEASLPAAASWVRCVAFAPACGARAERLACGSQDGEVGVWVREGAPSSSSSSSSQPQPQPQSQSQQGSSPQNHGWTQQTLPRFNSVVFGVSWSPMGNILAVATGDNKVSLWKEGADGNWGQISTVAENGQMG